jgi:hypothetical protein
MENQALRSFRNVSGLITFFYLTALFGLRYP